MSVHVNSNRPKRAADSDCLLSEQHRPGKREKYTRIACKTCKSRKVKCTGNLPCNRCVELEVNCTYNNYLPRQDSHYTRNGGSQMAHSAPAVQQDLTQLLSKVTKICDNLQLPPSQPRGSSLPRRGSYSTLKRPRLGSRDRKPRPFVQSTSFHHTLHLAQKVLINRGLPSPIEPHPLQQPLSTHTRPTAAVTLNLLQAALPVIELGAGEVERYLDIFKLEIYTMYPCVDLVVVRENVNALFAAASFSNNRTACTPNTLELDIINIDILKAILAVAMSSQEDDRNRLGSNLEANLFWTVDENVKQETVEVEDIVMMVLLSIYSILRDEGVKAWRMAGVAAKSCMEVGLHKARSPSEVEVEPERDNFFKALLCCVYDLDSRCSFLENLPGTLHDRDIDGEIFKLGPSHRFLEAMVGLNRICSEVFYRLNAPQSSDDGSDERMEYLDFRVQKLVQATDTSEFLVHTTPFDPSVVSMLVSLRSLFELRANQIRIRAHARALSSTRAFDCQSQSVQTFVSLARTTVSLYLDATADGKPRRILRSTFEDLLMSSLCYMILAASHSPSKYGLICRRDFHTGLDLLSQTDSHSGGRTSQQAFSLVELRRLAESVNMPADSSLRGTDEDPQRFAAIESLFDEDELLETFDMTDQEWESALAGLNSFPSSLELTWTAQPAT